MIEKIVAIDKIEVVSGGIVQVRQRTSIVEDGAEIAFTYQRWTLQPGDDLSAQSEDVQAVCKVIWRE